jgi:2-polyprenyl-6-methoxyphenol hydroxylase-like FAD-dependent oxidoreductase
MAHANGHANKSVAIIGGGMAGLMCAVKLRQLGVRAWPHALCTRHHAEHDNGLTGCTWDCSQMERVVVFDTGKNAVGGRMSSRDVVVSA